MDRRRRVLTPYGLARARARVGVVRNSVLSVAARYVEAAEAAIWKGAREAREEAEEARADAF